MIEISDVLTIITILTGVALGHLKFARWVTNKIDSEMDMIHQRINDVKDTYVKRVDLDRDLTNLYAMLSNIKDDIRAQTEGIHAQTDSVNQRLDKFLDAIIKSHKPD